MADAWFERFFESMGNNAIGLKTGDLTVLLVADTFDLAALTTSIYASDAAVSSHEVVGAGYVAGGITLVSGADGYLAVGDGAHTITAIANPQWANSKITARYGVVYHQQLHSYLVYLIDFGGNISTNNETFEIVLDLASPLLTFNHNPDTINSRMIDRSIDNKSTPYGTGTVYFYLVTDAYVVDIQVLYTTLISNNDIAGVQGVGLTKTLESGAYIHRVSGDVVTFTNVTGTFRYLLAANTINYQWVIAKDFGTNQTATAEDVVIDFPNGYHKTVLLP